MVEEEKTDVRNIPSTRKPNLLHYPSLVTRQSGLYLYTRTRTRYFPFQHFLLIHFHFSCCTNAIAGLNQCRILVISSIIFPCMITRHGGLYLYTRTRTRYFPFQHFLLIHFHFSCCTNAIAGLNQCRILVISSIIFPCMITRHGWLYLDMNKNKKVSLSKIFINLFSFFMLYKCYCWAWSVQNSSNLLHYPSPGHKT